MRSVTSRATLRERKNAPLTSLIVVVPIYVLLTLGVYRVILEAFMVIFRIYEETKKIGERGQSQV